MKQITFAKQDATFAGLSAFTVQPRKGGKDKTLRDTDWVDARPSLVRQGISKVRATIPNCLGEYEQSVLLGIVNLCGRVPMPERTFLKRSLPGNGEACEYRVMEIEATLGGILKAARLASGTKAYARVKDAGRALGMVRVEYEVTEGNRTRLRSGEPLISYSIDLDADSPSEAVFRMWVSERLSSVFLPVVDGVIPEYVLVDMDERAGLSGDVARILYVHLCFKVGASNATSLTFRTDTLMRWLYAVPPRNSAEAADRRREVRKAVEAIAALGSSRIAVEWLDEDRNYLKVVDMRDGEGEGW